MGPTWQVPEFAGPGTADSHILAPKEEWNRLTAGASSGSDALFGQIMRVEMYDLAEEKGEEWIMSKSVHVEPEFRIRTCNAGGELGQIRKPEKENENRKYWPRKERVREIEQPKAEAEQQEPQVPEATADTGQQKVDIATLWSELCRLTVNPDPQHRQAFLNHLFTAEGIVVREAFSIVSTDDEGIAEPIEGVIGFAGEDYLVEYLVEFTWSWVEESDILTHLKRLSKCKRSRSILISASDFSQSAIERCREALPRKVVILWPMGDVAKGAKKKRDVLLRF